MHSVATGQPRSRASSQVRELQTLLGLELDEIGEYLDAFDRLEALRDEYRSGPASRASRRDPLARVWPSSTGCRPRVRERQARLDAFAAELEARAGRLPRRRA